ncbi:dendritic arbor reduction protein 1-like [Schistocerca serialis cubense]|uniref:dendritic arbor reduction protein 1-like n=1 Tax=Schistocerca serialis cubense TaxID=2023355 RepID=UPI00214F1FE6|nr:dendritic arbor reduction protein 1-like [Schistocerca serialis cubense]
MSAATGHSLNLMACVRESSPQEPPADADQTSRQEGKRRRFHPLRGLRRMFRRKAAPAGGGAAGSAAGGCRSDEEDAHHHHLHDHHHAHHHHHHHHADGAPLDHLQQEQLRCRSASELLAAEGPTARRRSGAGAPALGLRAHAGYSHAWGGSPAPPAVQTTCRRPVTHQGAS